MSARRLSAFVLGLGVAAGACATPDTVQRSDARVANDAGIDAVDVTPPMDAMDVATDTTALDTALTDARVVDVRASDAPVDDRSAADGAAMCSVGQTLCGGACVDLNTSTTHCGICDGPCDPEGTTRVSCVAGACEITCDRLHGNCDFNNYNGCETPFEDDRMNCGACGNQCFRTQNCCSGRCVDTPCP